MQPANNYWLRALLKAVSWFPGGDEVSLVCGSYLKCCAMLPTLKQTPRGAVAELCHLAES